MTTVVRGFDGLGRNLIRKVDKFEVRILGMEKTALLQSAKVVERSVQTFMGGPFLSLEGARSRTGVPAKVFPYSIVTGSGRGASAVVAMKGPAHLVERDTSNHEIYGRDDEWLAMPGTTSGFRTGPFNHPGTTGKHFFRDGTAAAEPLVARIYQREVAKAAAASFKG